MNLLNPVSITREFTIDAGHRVFNHEGKCRSLHGHRYVFEVTCTAPALDTLGRVIDFSVIKELVGEWLEIHWDHATILWDLDPINSAWGPNGALHGHKVYSISANPTIENLCRYLVDVVQHLLKDTEISVVSIKGHETAKCSAEVRVVG
jgi:6-pyruvoyltetrahydropterin/6-carboxytetrahydropterin synthase